VSYHGKDESFEITYHVDGNHIIQNKTIQTDFLMLPVEELKDWNKMVTEMDKAYKENIVFIKK